MRRGGPAQRAGEGGRVRSNFCWHATEQKYTVSVPYVPWAAARAESMTIPQTGSLTFIAPRHVGPGYSLLGARGGNGSPEVPGPFPPERAKPAPASVGTMVEELSAREVSERLKRGDPGVLLLDVREPDEREMAVIEPSVHIPMRQVPGRLAELPKEREIIVYCHAGGRSAMIAGFLESKGFPHVANLSGGIDAWSRTVDPRVPRYG